MRSGLTQDQADVIEGEFLSETNPSFRRVFLQTLQNILKLGGVRNWLLCQYAGLSEEERKLVFSKGEDPILTCGFIAEGYVPEDVFLESVARGILAPNMEKSRDFSAMEAVILERTELANRYGKIKTRIIRRELQKEHLELQKEVIRKELTAAARPLDAATA